MNLCDIHYHWNAEHKSKEYSTFIGLEDSEHSGWVIVEPASTDPAYRSEHDIAHLLGDDVHDIGVIVGDTIEVHFVHSSCNVKYEELNPANGLGNCATSVCANPQLYNFSFVFIWYRILFAFLLTSPSHQVCLFTTLYIAIELTAILFGNI